MAVLLDDLENPEAEDSMASPNSANLDALASILNDKITNEKGDLIFTLGSTFTATLLFPDGGYKKKPVVAGDEFTLRPECRGGKRGDMIFSLEPVDARDYSRMEMNSVEAFRHLEKFKVRIEKLIDLEWSKAITSAATIKEHAKAKKEADTYADNPLWGIF
ncbi:hypothetical protein [Inquilinus sp. OTU3971]|uniref:hypothetical protein n=1 Tax=Inquilinus sp. OTU3971 TaxID=3043855 RepID=UPI00313B33C3